MLNSQPLVLLLEDQTADAVLLELALKRTGPAEFVHHENALNAITYLEDLLNRGARLPGIILLDLLMQPIGGLEVLAWIRQQAQLKETPVIILSGSDCPMLRGLSMELGACEFVRKPQGYIEYIPLLEKLRARYLRRKPAAVIPVSQPDKQAQRHLVVAGG